MNRATRTVIAIAAAAVIVLAFLLTAPKHPVALIQVVDSTGRPIKGAVIRPDGLRPKAGPYATGHYPWMIAPGGVPNHAVATDKRGLVHVSYPKYVFERIETGQISFSVDHPDFIPDRPFREVSTVPPHGAPWRVWLDYLWARLHGKGLISRTEPVVLQQGAALRVQVAPDSPGRVATPFFAQVCGHWMPEPGFWTAQQPGVLLTRRLPPGKQAVRAVRFEPDGAPWFSEVIDVNLALGQTNETTVRLAPTARVRGELDGVAMRPINNGRVVAHVWPTGHKPEDQPPQWHAWAPVRADGSFDLGFLPAGDLEVVALCDGFVSTNGPGQFKMRYPQKHTLGTNDLAVTVGMERTARLEVQVKDDGGAPIDGVRVVTWPNVRYGEWGAMVLLSDCYNASDVFQGKPAHWGGPVQDFEGKSDSSGMAVLSNLPSDVTEFTVEHPQFALPAVNTPVGDKLRQASVTLVAGATNHTAVTLVPRDRSPIRHY